MESYKIGDLSSKTDVSIDTIRYYEKIGLIPKASRLENSYRYYNDNDIAMIKFISLCKSSGFKLKEIKSIKDLFIGSKIEDNTLTTIVKGKIIDLDSKISELKEQRAKLEILINECNFPDCTLSDFI